MNGKTVISTESNKSSAQEEIPKFITDLKNLINLYRSSANINFVYTKSPSARGWIEDFYLCYQTVKSGNIELPFWTIPMKLTNNGWESMISGDKNKKTMADLEKQFFQNKCCFTCNLVKFYQYIWHEIHDINPNIANCFKVRFQLKMLHMTICNYYECLKSNTNSYITKIIFDQIITTIFYYKKLKNTVKNINNQTLTQFYKFIPEFTQKLPQLLSKTNFVKQMSITDPSFLAKLKQVFSV